MLMSDTDEADFAYEFLLSFIYDVTEFPCLEKMRFGSCYLAKDELSLFLFNIFHAYEGMKKTKK